ncbi:hypothetical protein C2S52_015933 [Perilla frutescens var. hirtella]|nr:hypothetical protein C2S52_015933 [Perilla frutescens var. hirtella]
MGGRLGEEEEPLEERPELRLEAGTGLQRDTIRGEELTMMISKKPAPAAVCCERSNDPSVFNFTHGSEGGCQVTARDLRGRRTASTTGMK